MRRVWAWMALNFGKHAGIVGVVGLAITLVLGVGITKLDFATGQDSYLNKDEQVYKDSVAYQDLFGGQAMVTLFTMDEGQTVTDLFTPENIAHLQQVEEDLRQTEGVFGVVSPLTALRVHPEPGVQPDGRRHPERRRAGPARRTRPRARPGGPGDPPR